MKNLVAESRSVLFNLIVAERGGTKVLWALEEELTLMRYDF